ncbi:YdhR family protein [Corynebacterium sp. YIM 101645]|uniref:YdhR family protein n=1 Tax=Corynebacterium lemuris TaxID=1859292 RepID=A0ABT2FTF6_9CORY|nr:YdhR family protein [Corynebacterium lemuris]MCS5478085.1 YdhR family protein [Corynebacterium lemuris]
MPTWPSTSWTEDPQRQVAGGVYLFADAACAVAYVEKHVARLI